MGAPRRLAAALLRAVLRLAPAVSREWAGAILRELDFVPGEWSALWWALGSVAAVVLHAGRNWRRWFDQFESKGAKAKGEGRMNSTGKKAIGVVSGVVSALMLVGCAFALLRITDMLFPGLGIAQTEWTHWLSVIVIPECVFLGAAILLWRKRGPIAAGILLVAFAIGLHVVVHIAHH
jgi:hypothetical protein